MIVSILIGRKGSKGFAKKNIYKINNNPMAYYPMVAAKKCSSIDKHYISTDDEILMDLGKQNGFEVIERPSSLSGDKILSDDVYLHVYDHIKRNSKEKIDIIVMLMCNAPIITGEKIEEGINVLKKNKKYDSAITVSKYNMWTPIRAYTIRDDNSLHPFIDIKKIENFKDINCDRDSQGDTWFPDSGAFIARYNCFEQINYDSPAHKLIGNKIYPIKQELGLDVDYKWQIPQVEEWITNNIGRK
jgi:CMP-N-acetylneuraminic acid synthetase